MSEIPVEALFVGLIVLMVFIGALIMAPSIKAEAEFDQKKSRIRSKKGRPTI